MACASRHTTHGTARYRIKRFCSLLLDSQASVLLEIFDSPFPHPILQHEVRDDVLVAEELCVLQKAVTGAGLQYAINTAIQRRKNIHTNSEL